MTTNEIKKALYKQNPIASLLYIRKNVAYYFVVIELENKATSYTVNFHIPIEDMGDADFKPLMESKLLNRWIVNSETN